MDTNRIYPPNYAILHNSVSPEGDDIRKWSNDQWANWFSQIGYSSTYNKQYIGLTYKGKPTYSAVQKCVVPNGDGTNIFDDTWRVIHIIDNPEQHVTWGCGNWEINRRCDNYEFYGRYDNKECPDNAIKAFADDVRNTLEALNGGMTIIKGHKEVSLSPTSCPNRIMEKTELAVDMINNPLKFATVNLPKQVLQPIPEPIQPDYVANSHDIGLTKYVAFENINLYDIAKKSVVKTYLEGSEFDITRLTSFEGVDYAITSYSATNGMWNGLPLLSLIKLEEMDKYNKKIKDLEDSITNDYISRKVVSSDYVEKTEFDILQSSKDVEINKLQEELNNKNKELAIKPDTIEVRLTDLWSKASPRVRYYFPYVTAFFGGLVALNFNADWKTVGIAVVTYIFTYIQSLKAIEGIAKDQTKVFTAELKSDQKN